MTLEHDIETINEYTQWKAVRQDTSPEAFVRDRAQQTAYARLSKGIEWMEACYVIDHNWESLTEEDINKLYRILNGEDE